MIVKIYIDNQLIDLYKDENIEVVSSVADISDITKNTTDYSKSFTVPASANNNKIFKHYYNADIDNTFDARTKVDGRIELNGIPFRVGKFRLDKVSIKKGCPSAYTINFFGNLVSLKDLFRDDELSALDLSAYNHSYNTSNVENGLKNSLFGGDVIYNLLTKRQLKYDNSNDNTDKLTNINWSGGAATGISFNQLQPSLKVFRIIEAIENKYGINFSNDFFGLPEFTDIFMWLNQSSEVVLKTKKQVDFDGGNSDNMNFVTDIGTYTSTFDGLDLVDWELTLNITPNVGYVSVPYKLLTYKDGVLFSSVDLVGTGGSTTVLSISGFGSKDFDVYYEIETAANFIFTANLTQRQRTNGLPDFTNVTTGSPASNNIALNIDVSALMPKMKVIDFMRGIFQMFKLVVIHQDDGTIYVDTLQNYYTLGNTYDITKYIDFDAYDVERGNILNTIKYKFSEPTTIVNQQFKKNNLVAYGDLEAILKDDNGVLLDGGSLDFTLPFEQIVYDRLINLNTTLKTEVVYGSILNESLSVSNPKPHLFYNLNTDISSSPIALRNDLGNRVQINTTLNNPSHVNSNTTQTHSLIFNNEFNIWNGALIENTLFTNYHQKYINDIFNIKKREFKFKAFLPIALVTKLKLNDRLRIKDNFYLIDNMNLNLINGQATLNLINLL